MGELNSLYVGKVINRDDPENLSRVKISIPGIIDPDDVNSSPWALPKGGGSKKWGKNDAPPIGADIFVQFVNGRVERPVYEPGWHGKPDTEDGNFQTEAFPEHEDPDVHVWGRGPFRVVVDNRDDQKTARLKFVKELPAENGNGIVEEDIAWIEFNYETDSIQIYAPNAIGLEAGALIDMKASAIQLIGRKVIPVDRPVN
jgi:hypothetical protein